MSSDSSPPAPGDRSPNGNPPPAENPAAGKDAAENEGNGDAGNRETQNGAAPVSRSGRPTRACTVRAAARLQQLQQQQSAAAERRPKTTPKKERRVEEEVKEEEEEEEEELPQQQSGTRAVTPLVEPPPPTLLPRWNLRCMWELASVLNFLHVFRPLLNISLEFSAEEFETALLTPNDTLGAIHMPILKAIPPITRMALTRDTWITVLCRKLRDWWHWVAEGELPIVASHGTEIELYKSLDPSVRVKILKALCDIRVEQEDIRNYIENSLKHGVQLSTFRKERIGGDTPYGVHYWYEDDPFIGHRLYREIRKVEVKKAKARGSQVVPVATYQWETLATNLDEFQDISEKLFTSNNRTEVSIGKKIKNDMLPEIEKVHKRKERLLKKQHREALLLDSFVNVDGLAPGRSLRDRKKVTYTFDDYDRSINEAIKTTKKEPALRREGFIKPEVSINGQWDEALPAPQYTDFSAVSPNSPYSDDAEEHNLEQLDRRRRRRPQRYSEKDFVEAVSDMEADLDSDDDIVGEAVYDEEYLRKRKQRKLSSSSEGDEEYNMDEENAEDEEEYEGEESLGLSDDSDEPPKFKKLRGRTRRETKLRLVRDIDAGLRRSKRSTRNRINYRQYELSESDNEAKKPPKWKKSNEQSEASESPGYSNESQGLEDNGNEEQELKDDQGGVQSCPEVAEKEEEDGQSLEKSKSPSHEEVGGEGAKRGFLDLNELAPGSGFDDSPSALVKDADTDDNF